MAVKRAMSKAACTVCSIAALEKSLVEALLGIKEMMNRSETGALPMEAEAEAGAGVPLAATE